MTLQKAKDTKARPFLKWAGGKTQLLSTLDTYLPDLLTEEKDITYIEPFLGGGAMLFHLLQHYPSITRAIVNDINPHLTNVYKVIRDNPLHLISILEEIQSEYRTIADNDNQKEFYLSARAHFNDNVLNDVDEAALMIFLNRTCFNGLYRENSKGKFNVPFGKYTNPSICDRNLLLADSERLQSVEILSGDFSQVEEHIGNPEKTFIYLDPPYRPIGNTSCFTSYVGKTFDDCEQLRLRDFFEHLTHRGCMLMLSNSDNRNMNTDDKFFDCIYDKYIIERVYAKRSINVNPNRRGMLSELLIRNYRNCPAERNNL